MLVFLILCVLPVPGAAEGSAPALVWAQTLGGIDSEHATAVVQSADGGYVVAGGTGSDDGDVVGHIGGGDVWVVKLDHTGEILWQRCLGGNDNEGASDLQQTADGGYIVAGYTYSNDVNVSGNHGADDAWVVKSDAVGEIVWQRCLGGSAEEIAYAVEQTADEGYIVSGFAWSDDGDVTGRHGDGDAWVVKLNATGGILWQQCLGGSKSEIAHAVRQTSDGGYILAGETDSVDGTVVGNHGNSDFWVVKLNASGGILWQKCLGGSLSENGYSVQQTSDGGYVVTGRVESNDGDVTGHHGHDFDPTDAWVVKLNATGGIVWQRCLGGTDGDIGYDVQQTPDGGFIMAGFTASTDGDVAGNHGSSDFWVVRLNVTGGMVWQKCLGGSESENAFAVRQTSDGGYVVTGATESNDGDVRGFHWKQDIWVVRLNTDPPSQVPGGSGVPRDLDHDAKYEDVNGNGRKDFADVVLYFNQMTWIPANEPVSAFDYNGNTRIDFADVVWLFNNL